MKVRYRSGLTYDIKQDVANSLAENAIKHVEVHGYLFMLKHDKTIGLVYEQVIPHRLRGQDIHNPTIPATDQVND